MRKHNLAVRNRDGSDGMIREFVWDGGFRGGGFVRGKNIPAGSGDWDPNLTPFGMGPRFPTPQSLVIPSGDLPGYSDGRPDLSQLKHPATDPVWLGDEPGVGGPGQCSDQISSFHPGAWDFNACTYKAQLGDSRYGVGDLESPHGDMTMDHQNQNEPGVGEIGLGDVYTPGDVAQVIGYLLQKNQITQPAQPNWANPQDWTGMLSNAGAAIYAALHPGAAPPPCADPSVCKASGPDDNAAQFLQAYVTAAGNLLRQYGPGGGQLPPLTIPAFPGLPFPNINPTGLNPMLLGLPAVLQGILPQLMAIPGAIPIPPVPAGVNPADYIAGLSNLATSLFGSFFPGRMEWPSQAEAIDFLKAAGLLLQHYLPNTPDYTKPPAPPPKIVDCGLPGWYFDEGEGKCMPSPGYKGPPHIGPTDPCVAPLVNDGKGNCSPVPLGGAVTPLPVLKVQCSDGTVVDDIAKCPKPKAAGGGGGGGSYTGLYILGGLGVLALIGVAAASAASPTPATKKKK